MHFLQPKRKENGDFENCDSNTTSTNDVPIILNEDSKDSLGGSSSKDEPVSKVTLLHESTFCPFIVLTCFILFCKGYVVLRGYGNARNRRF